jgi:hypothetical protein
MKKEWKKPELLELDNEETKNNPGGFSLDGSTSAATSPIS